MVSDDGSQIAKRCRDAGGMIQVELGELREELGYKKLGRWVLGEIAEMLDEARLGYFPLKQLDPDGNTELRQDQKVWIYDRDGSPRAQVLNVVLDPLRYKDIVLSTLDGLAGRTPSSLNSAQKLDLIREIVGVG